MIIAQMLHSLFFIFVSYILYLKYNHRIVKPIYIYSIIISGLILLVYNYFFNGLSNELFFILSIFSLSIVVIQFMRNFINVFARNKELEKRQQLKENILSAQNFMFRRLFIGIICIYQMLLIWVPAIFQKMTENQ